MSSGRSRSAWWAVGALALAGVLALTWLNVSAHALEASSRGRVSKGDQQPRSETVHAVSTHVRRSIAPPVFPVPTATATVTREREEELDPTQRLEQERALQARAVDTVVRAFERDARDAASGDTERAMYAALERSPAPDASVESLDCVGSMCRIVFATAGQDAQHGLMAHLLSTEGFEAEKLFSYTDDGLRATAFVARPGRSLPKPP